MPARRHLLIATLLVAFSSSPAPAEIRATHSGTALAARVAAELRALPSGTPASVCVADRGGRITLTGSAATLAAREQIARAAEGITGVRFVEPRMTVRPREKVSDGELAERLRELLREESGFTGPALVEVAVSKGRVRLTGTVTTAGDRERSEQVVRSSEGPVAISNEVVIDPVAGARKLEVEIVRLLAIRDVEVKDLQVVSDGGTIVINGEAHRVLVRRVVDEFVRQLPGGETIVNGIGYVLTPAAPVPASSS